MSGGIRRFTAADIDAQAAAGKRICVRCGANALEARNPRVVTTEYDLPAWEPRWYCSDVCEDAGERQLAKEADATRSRLLPDGVTWAEVQDVVRLLVETGGRCGAPTYAFRVHGISPWTDRRLEVLRLVLGAEAVAPQRDGAKAPSADSESLVAWAADVVSLYERRARDMRSRPGPGVGDRSCYRCLDVGFVNGAPCACAQSFDPDLVEAWKVLHPLESGDGRGSGGALVLGVVANDAERASFLDELREWGGDVDIAEAHTGLVLVRLVDPGPATHVLKLGVGRWDLQHPLSCRPRLFECEVTLAARRLDGPLAEPGLYEVDLDAAGELVVGERLG